MVELINRHIGKFKLDATEQENTKSVLRTTKNPVESGANVADHAVLEPKTITIKGKIVDYEPPNYTRTDEIVEIVRVNLPRVKKAHKFTQKILKIKAEVEHLKTQIDRYGRVIFGIDTQRVIAPFLPDFATNNKDNSKSSGRIETLYTQLLVLQRNGVPFEVRTGIKTFKNMLISSIEATTVDDTFLDVTLTLEELFIVETKTANGLKISKSVNFGKTQPQEQPDSMLHKIRKAF